MIWGNAAPFILNAQKRQFYGTARVCFGILCISLTDVGVYFGWWVVLNLELVYLKTVETMTLQTYLF